MGNVKHNPGLLFFLLVFIIVSALSSCRKHKNSLEMKEAKPGAIVENYLQAVRDNNKNATKDYWENDPVKVASLEKKVCTTRIQEILRKHTKWKIEKEPILYENFSLIEVVFKEPILNKLISNAVSRSMGEVGNFPGAGSFEEKLCKATASSLSQIPDGEIDSLPKKLSTHCFTLAKHEKQWKIKSRANLPCNKTF